MLNLIKDPTSENPYLRAGFPSRKAYLKDIAECFGAPYKKVQILADVLGEEEDFDALLTMLDDMGY